MKRLISVLLAAAMTVSAMSVSAFAEEMPNRDVLVSEKMLESIKANPVWALGEDIALYSPGDVNLDGNVDAKDATLILYEFNFYTVLYMGHALNDAQRSLANTDTALHPKKKSTLEQDAVNDEIDSTDALAILHYANYKLIGGEMTAEEFFAAWNVGNPLYCD